jgi:hypothetical protein
MNLHTFNSKSPFSTFHLENKDGREWIVSKGVPIVEGVLNGMLASMDEFGLFVKDWDGVPLVLRHPKQNNGSARVPNPDVPVIGRFFGAALDPQGKRMTGEYWFDKASLLSFDEGKRLHDDLLAGKMLETSTGYYANIDNTPGQYLGLSYTGIQHEIHPDHIAILPDEIGACSLRDGCGVNRNSMEANLIQNMTGNLPAEGKKLWEKVYEESKSGGDDEETAAKKAWGACKEAGWKQDKDEKWVQDNSQAPSQDYHWLVRLFSKSKQEKHTMDMNQELVTKILNEAGYTVTFGEGKNVTATPSAAHLSETLTGLESIVNEMGGTAKFKEMLLNVGKFPTCIQNLTDTLNEVKGNVQAATVMAQNAAAKAEAEKKDFVARLIANAQCPFNEEELNAMALNALQKLEASYRPTNYAALGAGQFVDVANAAADDILGVPSLFQE